MKSTVDFKQFVFSEKDTLLKTVRKQLKHRKPTIVDVIFFPGFDHSPMVRIDGTGMTIEAAIEIEAASPFTMVRIPELAGAISDQKFSKLVAWAKNSNYEPLSVSGRALVESATNFLQENNIDISSQTIWEIECDGDDITIRLVPVEGAADRETRMVDGVRVEHISSLDNERAIAMLNVFDAAKEQKQLFLEFLRGLVE